MAIRGRKQLLIAGVAVAALGVGAVYLRAWDKVLSGNGLETYRNYRGALMSYNGAVVAGVLCALCMVAALVVRWWHHRQQRKYDEILRARASATNTALGKSAGTGS